MKLWFIVPIVGIVGIIVLECVALVNGVNGTVLALAIGLIASIATGGAIKLKSLWSK